MQRRPRIVQHINVRVAGGWLLPVLKINVSVKITGRYCKLGIYGSEMIWFPGFHLVFARRQQRYFLFLTLNLKAKLGAVSSPVCQLVAEMVYFLFINVDVSSVFGDRVNMQPVFRDPEKIS